MSIVAQKSHCTFAQFLSILYIIHDNKIYLNYLLLVCLKTTTYKLTANLIVNYTTGNLATVIWDAACVSPVAPTVPLGFHSHCTVYTVHYTLTLSLHICYCSV